MTQPYHRTAAQRSGDFAEAREWEEQLAAVFGPNVITQFDSKTAMDIWIPGYYVEAKEKKQRYTTRWHLLPGVAEADLFIIDELTIRRAAEKYPAVFFVLRDRPEGRLFLAPIWELIGVERVRVDRVKKGKWIINIRNFHRIKTEAEIPALASHLLADMGWRASPSLTRLEVPQA